VREGDPCRSVCTGYTWLQCRERAPLGELLPDLWTNRWLRQSTKYAECNNSPLGIVKDGAVPRRRRSEELRRYREEHGGCVLRSLSCLNHTWRGQYGTTTVATALWCTMCCTTRDNRFQGGLM
jgi:hypothetical protein